MPVNIKDIAKKTQERMFKRKLKTVTNDTKIEFDNEPEIVTPIDNEPILENIPESPEVNEAPEESEETPTDETDEDDQSSEETPSEEKVNKPIHKKKHKKK